MALAGKLLTERGTLQACSRIILGDLGLTLRLLKLANSAMFNHSGKTVTSVTHAAALMGTDALSQMVETIPRQPLVHPVKELLVMCQMTAVTARNLMVRLEPRFAEEAYVSGLFRNMGELCYALELPAEYQLILAKSMGSMVGLRAACRTHAQFDFDELSAGLLHYWSFHGSPVLAAQSNPEALLAQQGNPEAEVALAASVAHLIVAAYFRSESAEREKLMRPCWGALAKVYQMRDAQVEVLCNDTLESVENLLKQMSLTREKLRLKDWVPACEVAKSPTSPASVLPPGTSLETVLLAAISKGIDRAAWLKFDGAEIRLGATRGEGWPEGGPELLSELVHPRKPPYLLAFGQRQDVWIDFGKDNRFRDSALAQRMQPTAYFLLPVYEGRKVRGCLYFDWVKRREYPPETVLPALSALRDYVTTNMPEV